MMKKITSLLLALMLVASLVACGGNNEPTEPQQTEPQQTEPQMELTIDPISFLELSLNENSLMAFPNEDGSLYVAYVGDVTKKGSVSSDAITAITYALEQSGLIELNGQEEYLEGEAAAVAYVTYGENYLSANYTGTIPQAYTDGYKVMEDCFKELTADMAEYVPAPTVYGELADSDKIAIDEIVGHLSIEGIEYFGITNIAKDENFAFSTGLSSYEGIESAVKLMPGTNTTPYSLVIVTVSEGTSVETVAQEFETNIDKNERWREFGCVFPSNAAIAVKDNQVLCLLGADEQYQQTITAIGEAGWSPVANLENPDM